VERVLAVVLRRSATSRHVVISPAAQIVSAK
jgi:hypothetical protein